MSGVNTTVTFPLCVIDFIFAVNVFDSVIFVFEFEYVLFFQTLVALKVLLVVFKYKFGSITVTVKI